MLMIDVVDAFMSKEGKSVDKWENYLGVYGRELARFAEAGRPVDLLEIGVQNGGSLELWASILPAGSRVIGADIDPKVLELSFRDQRVTALLFDATDPVAVSRSLGTRTFDVVIDDGSHVCGDVWKAFALMWPRLRDGGAYVVEDLHCSYKASHGGGLSSAGSSMAFLKALADAVNIDHLGDGASALGEGAFEGLPPHFLAAVGREVASVTFYDSIAVIERAAVRRAAPFARVFSGDRDGVADNLSHVMAEGRASLSTILLGDGMQARVAERFAARALDAEARLAGLAPTLAENVRLREEVASRDELLGLRDAEAARMQAEIDGLRVRAVELSARAERAGAHARARLAEELGASAAREDVLSAAVASAGSRAERALAGAAESAAAEASVRVELQASRMAHSALQSLFDLRLGEIMDSLAAMDQVERAPHSSLADRVRSFVAYRRDALDLLPEIASLARQVRFHEAVAAAAVARARSHLADALPVAAYARLEGAAFDRSRSGRILGFLGRTSPFSMTRRAAESMRTPSEGPSLGLQVFDPARYLSLNPDLAGLDIPPEEHFMLYGDAEGRPFNPDFDHAAYGEANPDAVERRIPLFLDYLLSGVVECRATSPAGNVGERLRGVFARAAGLCRADDALDFVRALADAAEAGSVEPGDAWLDAELARLADVIRMRVAPGTRGRGPTSLAQAAAIEASGLFDPVFYASRHPGIDVSGPSSALAHFLSEGRRLGAAPNAHFDPVWYSAQDPGVGGPANALLHFISFGADEGRATSPDFDPRWYASRHPGAGVSHAGALAYHVARGAAEGRDVGRPSAIEASARLRVGPVPTSEVGLRMFAESWSPLPVYRERDGAQTVDVVTDSVAPDSLFGGVGTAIVVGLLLARRLGARFRLVTRHARPTSAALAEVVRAHGIEWDGSVDFAHIPLDGTASLSLGDRDIVVTTSWWTTAAALCDVPKSQVLYLLQEDERMFYPRGDLRLRCAETLRCGVATLVNTGLLADDLRSDGAVAGPMAHFEPAFPASAGATPRAPADRMRLFFYARPGHARNLYWRGLEALERACAEGIFDPDSWEFVFVGGEVAPLSVGGIVPELVAKLPWTRYVALTRTMDLALCLMDTPHPSYPPLDLAAAGAVVVTNRSGGKRDLSALSRNILCVEPDLDVLVGALGEGVRLSFDRASRDRNFRDQAIPFDWDACLAPAFDAILPSLPNAL